MTLFTCAQGNILACSNFIIPGMIFAICSIFDKRKQYFEKVVFKLPFWGASFLSAWQEDEKQRGELQQPYRISCSWTSFSGKLLDWQSSLYKCWTCQKTLLSVALSSFVFRGSLESVVSTFTLITLHNMSLVPRSGDFLVGISAEGSLLLSEVVKLAIPRRVKENMWFEKKYIFLLAKTMIFVPL